VFSIYSGDYNTQTYNDLIPTARMPPPKSSGLVISHSRRLIGRAIALFGLRPDNEWFLQVLRILYVLSRLHVSTSVSKFAEASLRHDMARALR